MMDISTYICERGQLRSNGLLIPIDRFEGPVNDPLYIYGAVEISVQGKQLISRNVIDLIDQVWGYLINGVASIAAQKRFSTYFPDQPILLEMVVEKGNVLKMSIQSNRVFAVRIDKDEATTALLSAGLKFFERLRSIVPSKTSVYDSDIRRIKSLQDR